MNLDTIQETYYFLTAISSSIILLLGFLLLRLRLPADVSFNSFNKIRIYLSASYAILGVSGVLSCFMQPVTSSSMPLLLITTSVAAFQSLLFTVVHMLLLQSNSVSRRNINQHILAIVAAISLLSAVSMSHIVPDMAVSLAALVMYLALQAYYISKFNALCRTKEKFKGFYYTKFQNSRIRTIVLSFYSSFGVGILSLAASIAGLWLYIIFIVVYTLYYTHVVLLMFNKLSPTVSFENIMQVQNNAPDESRQKKVTVAESEEKPSETAASGETDEAVFKANLKKWVAAKGFAQCDLSVDEVAEILGTNRNFLRKYFRDNVHSDFRTWRSELRIEEAKQLLLKYPDHSTTQIGEMVGFNHRSNFFTQFTKITGITPTDWRRDHGIITD